MIILSIKSLKKHIIDYKLIITKKEKLENIQKAFDYYVSHKDEQIKVLIKS